MRIIIYFQIHTQFVNKTHKKPNEYKNVKLYICTYNNIGRLFNYINN